jgi:hypothetical protein
MTRNKRTCIKLKEPTLNGQIVTIQCLGISNNIKITNRKQSIACRLMKNYNAHETTPTSKKKRSGHINTI